MSKCEELIVTYTKRGMLGFQDDPSRLVCEIFRKDGEKIAEHDPCGPRYGYGRWACKYPVEIHQE